MHINILLRKRYYNDALTEGDSDKITQAAGEFETVDTAVQSLLKNSDIQSYQETA